MGGRQKRKVRLFLGWLWQLLKWACRNGKVPKKNINFRFVFAAYKNCSEIAILHLHFLHFFAIFFWIRAFSFEHSSFLPFSPFNKIFPFLLPSSRSKNERSLSQSARQLVEGKELCFSLSFSPFPPSHCLLSLIGTVSGGEGGKKIRQRWNWEKYPGKKKEFIWKSCENAVYKYLLTFLVPFLPSSHSLQQQQKQSRKESNFGWWKSPLLLPSFSRTKTRRIFLPPFKFCRRLTFVELFWGREWNEGRIAPSFVIVLGIWENDLVGGDSLVLFAQKK